MKMIKAIAAKEFIHIIRDPRTLGIILILPLFQLLMFGYALSLDIDSIPTAVYDRDRTATSRKLIESFSSSGYFNITARPVQADFAERLDDGRIKVAIVIPEGFAEDLLSDKRTRVQVIVDGSDPTLARVGVGYSSAIIGRFSSKATAESLYRRGLDVTRSAAPVQTSSRVWYNPELRSVNFIVPGLMALILMTVTTITISLAVVREKEKGTLENLIISPIKSWELILGKIAPYVVIAFLEALLITATGMLWFNVPMNGSFILLLMSMTIYVAGTLGLGLVISAATDSQQVASFGAFMATFLPSFLLSGFVFPIKSMPFVLQLLTYIVPARYFLVVIRGIFLKGTGFDILWPDLLALVVFAALMLTIASVRLRRAFA